MVVEVRMAEIKLIEELNRFKEENKKVINGVLYGIEIAKDSLQVQEEGQTLFQKASMIRELQTIIYTLYAEVTGKCEKELEVIIKWYTDENDPEQARQYIYELNKEKEIADVLDELQKDIVSRIENGKLKKYHTFFIMEEEFNKIVSDYRNS